MGFLQKLDLHADLVNRMADTLGANLADALQDQRVSAMELRNAVMSCMGCEGTDACVTWLHEHGDSADDTPEYCRNHEMLTRLRG